MEIIRCGSLPSNKAPEEYFTGTVRLDPYFMETKRPSCVTCTHVTFEPGARTAWHSHPLGQIIVITSGSGRVQREGGVVEEIHSGDAVRFAPNERHWHGASETTAMSHIAIQEEQNGSFADWQEKVTSEQYSQAHMK